MGYTELAIYGREVGQKDGRCFGLRSVFIRSRKRQAYFSGTMKWLANGIMATLSVSNKLNKHLKPHNDQIYCVALCNFAHNLSVTVSVEGW